jgi:hypothetical protein
MLMKSISLIICIFCAVLPARAVIVAGANGGANNTNNTTEAQLESLPSVSDGHFLNNVFSMGGGNGVYIGFHDAPGGPIGYALSGMHLNYTSNLTIQGTTYTFESREQIDGSDLALYSFSHPTDMMPDLRALNLATSTPTGSTPVVMIGYGRGRDQNATTDAFTTDAITPLPDGGGTGYTSGTRELRWGTNETELFGGTFQLANLNLVDVPGGTPDTLVNQTIFDEPADGDWLTTTEAQAVVNDSGGGLFAVDGTLLGIMVAVGAPDRFEAAFGNATYSADIASYRPIIEQEIGLGVVLIPEVSQLWMVAGCFALFWFVKNIRVSALKRKS